MFTYQLVHSIIIQLKYNPCGSKYLVSREKVLEILEPALHAHKGNGPSLLEASLCNCGEMGVQSLKVHVRSFMLIIGEVSICCPQFRVFCIHAEFASVTVGAKKTFC